MKKCCSYFRLIFVCKVILLTLIAGKSCIKESTESLSVSSYLGSEGFVTILCTEEKKNQEDFVTKFRELGCLLYLYCLLYFKTRDQ